MKNQFAKLVDIRDEEGQQDVQVLITIDPLPEQTKEGATVAMMIRTQIDRQDGSLGIPFKTYDDAIASLQAITMDEIKDCFKTIKEEIAKAKTKVLQFNPKKNG